MRSVSVRLADLMKTMIPLGFVGENEHTRVVIDSKKVFDDYPLAIPALTVKPPKGDAYPAVTIRDGDLVLWDVTDSDVAQDGYGEFQLTFTQNGVIAKSYIGKTHIEKSLLPTGEEPEPVASWIVAANTALNAIPQDIATGINSAMSNISADAETLEPDASATATFDTETQTLTIGVPKGEQGDPGDPGDPGYSPSASVSKSGSTATISITDANGTTTATISDGDPTTLIDDTAGDGDTGVTWSADKLVDELGDKYELPSGGIPSSDMASAVQTSLGKADTAYQKPSGGIPADDIASGVIPSVTGKADKVSSAVSGNFAGLDGNGNLTDSGHKHSDYLTSHQDITGKADKVSSATSGDFAGLDGNGNLTDSGKKASDFVAGSSFYATEMPMASNDSTKVGTEIGNLKSEINVLQPSATSGDVGKFLKAKTVADGKVTEYEFGSASGGSVSDVQINGKSILSQGVANVPVANANNPGVVKVATGSTSGYGIYLNGSNQLETIPATSAEIKNGTALRKLIAPITQHESVFYGLAKVSGDSSQSSSANAVGVYTEDALSKISDMLNAPVTVSGSTPSITAKAGVRYICGEVSTLTITVPTSGCIDVVFESGSTATVLTVTPTKTGVTAIKWANGFDPSSLDTNTTYELNILDGEYGVSCAWV